MSLCMGSWNETGQDGMRIDRWPDQARYKLIFSLVLWARSLSLQVYSRLSGLSIALCVCDRKAVSLDEPCIVGSVSPESTV